MPITALLALALDHHELVIGHVVLVRVSVGQLRELQVVLLDDLSHELRVVLRVVTMECVVDIQMMVNGQLGDFLGRRAVGFQASQQGIGGLDLRIADLLARLGVEFANLLCALLENALLGSLRFHLWLFGARAAQAGDDQTGQQCSQRIRDGHGVGRSAWRKRTG